MADLKLSIDVSDAIKATQVLSKVEGNIRNLGSRLSSNSITQNTYNEGLREQNAILRQTGVSVQKATTMIHGYAKSLQQSKAAQDQAADMSQWFASQRRKIQMMAESERLAKQQAAEEQKSAQKAAQAVEAQAKELDRLRTKYDPLYAASQLYEKSLNEINLAQQKGAISTQRQIQLINQLNIEYQEFAAGSAAATNRFVTSQMASARGMNAMGVGMQQAGYQIGDFLVQIQSGTNAFVAFGQQATQLVGILPMFNSVMGISGTRLIGLSAVLGIAIPLVTALAAAFVRTRKSADSASGGYTTAQAAMQSAREETSRMADEIERLNRGLRSNTELFVSKAIEEQKIRVAQAQERVNSLEQDPDGLALAEEMLRREQQTLNTYEAQLKELEDKAKKIDEINNKRDEEADRDRELIDLQRQYRESLRETQRAQLEALLEAGRVAEEGRKTREQIASSLQQETELYRLIAQFGEDSVQVEELRAKQARAAHLARIQETTTNGVLIRQAMEHYDAMVEARKESEDTTAAMEELAGLNLRSLRAEIDFLIRKLNIGEDAARRLALAMPIGVSDGTATRGGRGMTLAMGRARPNFARDLGIGRYADKPERGGAGGPDVVERLQQEIAFRQRALNLSGEERTLQEEIFRITQALGEDRNKYSSDFIANLAQQNLAIQEQERVIEEARQQQEQLADSIANSFGDAFMSIVDGTKSTKDAFKQMAAAIVKDLYQVYVMKRLIGSAEAGTGIAGFIGNLLTRESGGSMMAGRPYLVGERGPELVIPGRSATVANADLTNKAMGGSNGVTVVNNINVSGGTDPAAIRQEVAKLMPQITNATKSAVIDARRRGGQMKAAFG